MSGILHTCSGQNSKDGDGTITSIERLILHNTLYDLGCAMNALDKGSPANRLNTAVFSLVAVESVVRGIPAMVIEDLREDEEAILAKRRRNKCGRS